MMTTIDKVMEQLLSVQMRQSGPGVQTNSEYVTVKDAVEVLGISPKTPLNWGPLGAIVGYRQLVSTYRLYRRIDLKRLRKRLEQPQVSRFEVLP
jgi:hypothetical protein